MGAPPPAPVADVVLAVAGYGLGPAAHPLALPARPLDDTHWRALVGTIRRERLAGLLAAAVDDGALAVTDDQRRQARDLHRDAMATALRLDRALLRAVGVLEASGIGHRVLKGAATAHTLYPDPSQRAYVDVDLLVAPGRFDDAVAALLAAGAERTFPSLRPGFEGRFGKGATLVVAGHELDVHRSLAVGAYGLRLDPADLFASATPFELAGRRLLALDADARFLHACYHAALGDPVPRLVPQRDIAQHLADPADAPDAGTVLARAARWRGEAAVARGIALAAARFGLDDGPLVRWARSHRPTRRERWVLGCYVDDGRSPAAALVAGIGSVPGVVAKVAYVRAIAVPSRAHLDKRGDRHLRRWGRGVRTLGRRAVRR